MTITYRVSFTFKNMFLDDISKKSLVAATHMVITIYSVSAFATRKSSRNSIIKPSKNSQLSFSTIKAFANREDYDEDQGNQYSQYNQLNLHVLQPHFSPDLCPLTAEVLCL